MPPQNHPSQPASDTLLGANHVVLDLFAGTGVSVAVRDLGSHDYGVEIMPAAIASRELNGFNTLYNDAWDAHEAETIKFDTLWGSPPCQTFSMAGGGAGRRALDQVLGVISDKKYKDMGELRQAAADLGEERIGLVLSPLHYAYRFNPTYIALEQVPPVLPVWEAIAVELRELGYSVWTGIIHSEQYGVAQTRKRAYLIARRDGKEARQPVPTHSKYYQNNPSKLDEGVQKWVSMREALSFDKIGRWGFVATNIRPNAAIRPVDFPAPALAFGHERPQWVPLDENGHPLVYRNGTGKNAARRNENLPAPTVMFGERLNKVEWESGDEQVAPVRVSIEEAACLQSYPVGFQWGGAATKQFLQVGNAVPPLVAKAVLAELWS